MASFYVTREGYGKLKEKLDNLTRKRKEIAKSLELARTFGDLAENGEYLSAQQEQSLNEMKIAEVTEKLSLARVIDEGSVDTSKVCIGTTVKLKDLKYDEEIEYSLVTELEADVAENRISISSPVGKGLIGRAENDIVDITVPAGVMRYQILKISR